MLDDHPGIVDADPILACAIGDEIALRRALADAPAWVNRTPPLACPDCGAALGRPPLIAVTHSSLGRLAAFRDRLRRAATLLLDAGADPNQRWGDRQGQSLSALYGAAGLTHDPEMTRLLLRAGANPNDGESLYHSTESDDHACTTLLLDTGAIVEGTNALQHQLDKDDVAGLHLLLSRTRDPNDATSGIGAPLVWAIRRRRSLAHARALLDAGADPHVRTQDGVSAYRFARQNGLVDVADLIAAAGAGEALSLDDQFVAACAAPDRAEARRILSLRPNMIAALSERQLRQLPDLAAAGHDEAVELMVEVGWPIATAGGDWSASALNLAVFRGDATLTRFLLDHGASWTERHGFGSNVAGTLAWASRNTACRSERARRRLARLRRSARRARHARQSPRRLRRRRRRVSGRGS